MPIGDTEPEDAYDASDPIEERLRIVRLIVLAAETDAPRRAVRRAGAVRLLLNIAAEMLRDG